MLLKSINHPRSLLIGLSMLVGATVGIPQLAAAENTIEVAITGQHPAGKSWDGTRLFLLPVEMTTVTPPDLVLCIVTETTASCLMRGEELPLCPDAERCRFSQLALPTSQPFALVLFDHDNFGREVADGAALLARQTEAAASSLEDASPSASQSDGLTTFLGDASRLVRGLAGGAAQRLERVDGARLEWIDTLILTPDEPVSDTRTTEVISARVRDLISANAGVGIMNSWRNRMQGRFETRSFLDCAWPSPSCQTTYATFHIDAH